MRQEKQIDNCRKSESDDAREKDREPSEKPQHDEPRERPSQKGKPARPVWDCRLQEAGDYRPAITERHFTRLPDNRRERRRRLRRTYDEGDGQGNDETTPKRCNQKKGLNPADKKAGPVNGRYLGTGFRKLTTFGGELRLDLRRRFSMLGSRQCRYEDLRRAPSIDGA